MFSGLQYFLAKNVLWRKISEYLGILFVSTKNAIQQPRHSETYKELNFALNDEFNYYYSQNLSDTRLVIFIYSNVIYYSQ